MSDKREGKKPGNEEMGMMKHYLTGLPNSGGYIMAVRELEKTTELTKYTAFQFNLKGFGNINQRYGMDIGNKIIKLVAESLENFLEKDEILGHLGGDTFVALIKKDRKNIFCRFLNAIDVEVPLEHRTDFITTQ